MAAFGMTIPIDADASNFNKEMRKMDRSIKTTSGEIRDLSKSLKFEWSSKRFVEAQKKASEALKQTEIKAQALRDRLKHLDDVGTDKTSSKYKKLESQLTKTEAKAVLMRQKLKEINALKFDNISEQVKKVGAGITKAGQAMAPLSAAAAALIGSFAKIGQSAVTAGDYIGTTAQMLNISSTQLQKWLYIADQTDVESQQFVNAVTKMQGALAHLAAGESDITATALEQLGITAEEASLGMEANFEKIINSLANLEDATMQAYLANEIFGTRMGAKILPLLNDGGDGLAALGSEFEALGYISEEEVEKLDAFEDVMDKLKYQFNLIKNEIGSALLPTMEKLADYVQTTIIPAFENLKEKLAGLSQEQIENGLKILTLVAAIAPVLMIVGKLTSGVGSLIKIIPMLGQALSVLMAHPIILVIVGIIALLVHLYKTNEEFRKSINGLVTSLKTSLQPVLDAIIKLIKTLIVVFTPLFNVLAKIVNMIMKILVPVITFMAKIISGVLIKYINFLSKAYIGMYNIIIRTINGIISFAEDALNGVIDFINLIISQVNKLGKVLGFTIGKLDNVAFEAEVLQEVKMTSAEAPKEETQNTKIEEPNTDDITDQITNFDLESSPQTVVNNDNSEKTINFELVVQNYSTELDYDDIKEKMEIMLAGDM